MGTKKDQPSSSAAFKVGAISLAFLILGYQAALFIHRAAVLRIESVRDRPDTVFIYLNDPAYGGFVSPDGAKAKGEAPPGDTKHASAKENAPSRGTAHASIATKKKKEERPVSPEGTFPFSHVSSGDTGRDDAGATGGTAHDYGRRVEYHYAEHSARVERVRKATRKVESFRFNPNTAGLEEFQRLGFSEKQAQSLLNYRAKRGRFRRKEDFAKSFVVADSVFRRLEPYIDIPLLDINRADSAAFDALPGIGPWFAAKMVEYREEIGGYTSTEQLMDIDRFDIERYETLRDLVTCIPLSADDGSE